MSTALVYPTISFSRPSPLRSALSPLVTRPTSCRPHRSSTPQPPPRSLPPSQAKAERRLPCPRPPRRHPPRIRRCLRPRRALVLPSTRTGPPSARASALLPPSRRSLLPHLPHRLALLTLHLLPYRGRRGGGPQAAQLATGRARPHKQLQRRAARGTRRGGPRHRCIQHPRRHHHYRHHLTSNNHKTSRASAARPGRPHCQQLQLRTR